MKIFFDTVSYQCSKIVTKTYSTSFYMAVKMLAPSIRQDIHNIYGFVRFADEIVDTFHDYDREALFINFEKEVHDALKNKISLNPIINSFQHTVHNYHIEKELIAAFMKSMKMDLTKTTYQTQEEYKAYIYGSADVVGLMCLKVFVKGNQEKYNELKDAAMLLGSAFQKVNFLRDIGNDYVLLKRTYFPNTDFNTLDEAAKHQIIADIEHELASGYQGILKLPVEAKLGVYIAYKYYVTLLNKLKKTPPLQLKNTRIRIPNYQKFGVLAHSYVHYKLNLI
jgi:15-cis-phytoene synthase